MGGVPSPLLWLPLEQLGLGCLNAVAPVPSRELLGRMAPGGQATRFSEAATASALSPRRSETETETITSAVVPATLNLTVTPVFSSESTSQMAGSRWTIGSE